MVENVGRVFVGIDLDVATRHAIAASLAGLAIPGTVVPPTNWHITLRFIGTVDEVTFDRVSAALDQADLGSSFDVSFGELGAFPRARRANVFWRAIEGRGGRLNATAERVEDACQGVGLAPEDRPFRPHLTLARIRPDQDVRRLVGSAIEPVRMPVSHVSLFRSHLGRGGARYEVLEQFALE